MSFDPLSFILGKRGGGAPIRDTVSYLMGKAVSAVWKTITNVAVATFTAVAAPVRALVVDIDPVQSGSGDPSPDNVRPISGWTGASITVESTEGAGDGSVYAVSWQTEAGTVYGGTLDVTSGVLTISHLFYKLDGTETWGEYKSSSARNYYRTRKGDSGFFEYGDDNLCSHYQYVAISGSNDSVGFGVINSSNASIGASIAFRPDLSVYDTLEKFKTFLATQNTAGTPVTCICKIASPQTYQLTPTEVTTLLGDNYITADTGNINTITYKES